MTDAPVRLSSDRTEKILSRAGTHAADSNGGATAGTDRGDLMTDVPIIADTKHDEFNGPSDHVLLPAGSIVHQNGVPVLLITGALVRVARGNVPMLVGHHMGAAFDPPGSAAPR